MKASYSTKESDGSVSKLRFATTATILTLFSMGFILKNTIFFWGGGGHYGPSLLYVFVRSMFKHVASENGPLVLILQSYSQIFIVKYMD